MDLFYRVKDLMDGDEEKTFLWFWTDNPMLGNVAPVAMILAGRKHRLERFIDEAEEANRPLQG